MPVDDRDEKTMDLSLTSLINICRYLPFPSDKQHMAVLIFWKREGYYATVLCTTLCTVVSTLKGLLISS